MFLNIFLMRIHNIIIGHWKPGRKRNDFPITYTLTGSPQDVSCAKAEIDDLITKVYSDMYKLITNF